MSEAQDMLDVIELMTQKSREEATKSYKATITAINTNTKCSAIVNGKTYSNIYYYGDAPTINSQYRIFVPEGNMSDSFIIVGGGSGSTPTTYVTSVNGQTGNVTLNANDVGALPDSTQFVSSVDGSTGVVTTNAVKTTEQILTDSQKTQARTNIGAGTSSFSGSYNDLSNKPTIGDATLTIQKNSTSIGTFTANATANKSINIEVPTKASDLTNDSGYITSVPNVTTTSNGLMLATDKVKLNGIAMGAQVNTVTGVKGSSESTYRVGNISISKNNIGLGNVNNTSDANKPISSATQTALNLKANISSPALTGIPTAPTATAGTNTTQIATTAFVQSSLSAGGHGDMLKSVYDTNGNGIVDNAENSDTVGGFSVGAATNNSANSIVRTDNSGYLNCSWLRSTSGVLTGKPHGVWVENGNWLYYQTTDDFINNCGIATKEYTDTKAPLASPALTGAPTAPTPITGNNTTQIATTAFVQNTVSVLPKSLQIKVQANQPTNLSSGDFWYEII